jgi:tRNA(fMet)-specific endonuclease VapC
MIYVLDSNIISFSLNHSYNIERKIQFILEQGDFIVVSPISFYELMRGFFSKEQNRKLALFNQNYGQYIKPNMSRPDFLQAAKLYSICKTKNITISDNDLLQAAYCLSRNCTLVTNNTQHFCHVDGLLLEDWSK